MCVGTWVAWYTEGGVVRELPVELVLSLYHVGAKVWTQATGLAANIFTCSAILSAFPQQHFLTYFISFQN